MRKAKIIKNLEKAFGELGISLRQDDTFYELEYAHLLILLFVDKDKGTLELFTYVVDVYERLSEAQLEFALDVMEVFFRHYSGEWNKGIPYFASPMYLVGDGAGVTGKWLEGQLKEFCKAYDFLQDNIRLAQMAYF